MLCGDAARPWFRRRERPNWRLGVPGGQPDGHKQGQDRLLSVESRGSPGYDGGLSFDNWEISGWDSFLVQQDRPYTVISWPRIDADRRGWVCSRIRGHPRVSAAYLGRDRWAYSANRFPTSDGMERAARIKLQSRCDIPSPPLGALLTPVADPGLALLALGFIPPPPSEVSLRSGGFCAGEVLATRGRSPELWRPARRRPRHKSPRHCAVLLIE